MRMEPIVNGLEESYSDQVDFRSLDANTVDGHGAFRAYGLRGHPAFVLLNSAGNVLWTGLGEQPGVGIEDQIRAGLATLE